MLLHKVGIMEKHPEEIKCPWWILLLIPLIVGGYVLSSSASLGKLEELVTKHVENSVSAAVLKKTSTQYPQLEENEIIQIAQEQTRATLKDPRTKQTIQTITEEHKQLFQDEHGTPYLLEPDAYYYLRYAENIVQHGHQGETIKDGLPFDTLRHAPKGAEAPWTLLPAVEATWYRLVRILSPDTTILRTTFYLPVALGIISIALLFALTFTIFKRAETAFFASLLFAIHPYFFRQNMAGFTDTPSLIMPLSLAFFLSIIWLIEGRIWQRITAGICAIATLFALKNTWSGWFFVLGISAAFCIAGSIYAMLKQKRKNALLAALGIGIALTLLLLHQGYVRKILVKLQLTGMPGIQTTVKELARPTFTELISALGDPLFSLILLTAAGWLCIRIIRKNATLPEVFLFIWLIIMLLPAVRTLRFMLFIVPPATILAGWLMQKIQQSLTELTSSLHIASKKIASFSLLILLPVIAGATMLDTSNMPLPPMTDATEETAAWLKQNTGTEAIINTWWDHGYVWQYAVRRPTIIDAGPSTKSHWMAKALITEDELYAQNIIHMLDCRGLTAYNTFRKRLGANSTRVLEEVLKQPEELAEKTLIKNGIPDLINLTHCEFPEAYVIADKSMLDVISSIEAIASLDSDLSSIREITAGMTEKKALENIEKVTGLTGDDARQMYFAAQEETIIPPNKTVSTIKTCTKINTTVLECAGYTVDLEHTAATRRNAFPHSLTIIRNGTRTENVFPEEEKQLSLLVYQENDDYRAILMSPEYLNTLLIRLFAEDNIEGFTAVHRAFKPERIMTWKISSYKHQ